MQSCNLAHYRWTKWKCQTLLRTAIPDRAKMPIKSAIIPHSPSARFLTPQNKPFVDNSATRNITTSTQVRSQEGVPTACLIN